MQEHDEMRYAEMFSKWYSWGSPVGLSIFFISMALTTLLMIAAFNKVRNGSHESPRHISAEQVKERSL